MIELKGKFAEAKVYTDLIDNASISQLQEMINHEITENTKVRIMPDVHAGKGSTIGTTIKLPENFADWKVCPNIVGLDVGCSIFMYKIKPKDDKVDLENLDKKIHQLIPSGFNIHQKPKNTKFTNEILSKLTIEIPEATKSRITNSLGTLGGGNHFIELGIDEENNYWLSVHSGSRNLGVQVGKTHQDIAIQLAKDKIINGEDSTKEVIEKLKSEGKHREIEKVIKNLKKNNQKLTVGQKNLTYLSGDKLKDYLNDMAIAQKYAVKNRETMLDIIVEAMGFEVIDKFDSIHNFIEHNNFENGILRKGATSAKKGERLVIPLNMRDGSLICVGKGNDDWNQSAPHGAGRIMSRAQAKQNINLETLNEQMRDVYSSTISINTIDEGPDAYKPADIIKENIKDTADIIHQVKPIYNYKG